MNEESMKRKAAEELIATAEKVVAIGVDELASAVRLGERGYAVFLDGQVEHSGSRPIRVEFVLAAEFRFEDETEATP